MTREQETDEIYLVTEYEHHTSPDEYHAFETFAKALDYIGQYDLDEDDLTEYTAPGGEHRSARISDRRSVAIRTLELE